MTPAGKLDDGAAGLCAIGKAVRSTVLSDVEDDDAAATAAFGWAGVGAGCGVTAGVAATGARGLDDVVAGSGVLICGLEAVAGKAWDGATAVVGTTMVCCAVPIRAARAKAIMTDLAIPRTRDYARRPPLLFNTRAGREFSQAFWAAHIENLG